MAVTIKNNIELQKMRLAGKLARDTLNMIVPMIKPETPTIELDRAADKFIRSRGGVPASLNYRGFPKNICVSINEEVLHGIPGIRRLKNGDIVSVDICVLLDGFNGDAARTFICGTAPKEAARLVRVTEECFYEGLRYARAGLHLHQICKAVQDYAEGNGYSVVRDYFGHGIGRQMHEDPSVPCYKPPGRGLKLAKGMTLTIEPMICAGRYDVDTLRDGWTVVTKDKSLTAHYENTVAITDGEPEILTI